MIKIAVIGEVCIDKFVYCLASRLSPEAPVPVLKPVGTTQNPGMAGNVVMNLQALDKDLKISTFHQKENITKTRYVDKKSNHMFIRVDEGENNPCTRIEDLPDLKTFDMVIVSDYNKGFLLEEDLQKIAKNSKISILDTKKRIDSKTSKDFTFVKLNEQERGLNPHLDPHNLIITLGSRGSMYRGELFSQENPLETIDVSGAGDTFVASFALEYYRTKDIEKSIRFANKMSGQVVGKKGVSVPSTI
ncbi:hypothetical protein EBU71_06285 [bacterium]|nr:hypothetical protein [Candidatus Elulimicrobium humile]